MKEVVLTHNMVRTNEKGEEGRWRCIDCGRAGTIRFINLVVCSGRPAR